MMDSEPTQCLVAHSVFRVQKENLRFVQSSTSCVVSKLNKYAGFRSVAQGSDIATGTTTGGQVERDRSVADQKTARERTRAQLVLGVTI